MDETECKTHLTTFQALETRRWPLEGAMIVLFGGWQLD